MKIVHATPPNFEEILKTFPRAGDFGVIFAYGDTIYNPSAVEISPPLMAHEEVHGYRQRTRVDLDVDQCTQLWWHEYLTDPEFRYREEVAAHVAEMAVMMPRDRNARALLLVHTAKRLVAPLYNYGISKSFRQGMRDIQREFDRRQA
jgi:hypothetical protein